MNEAILYALENLRQTRNIHDVICDMKKSVLQGFDQAIRDAVPRWYNKHWEFHPNNLHNHYDISIYRQDSRQSYVAGRPSGKIMYIDLYLGDQNCDPIWEFLGEKSRHEGNVVMEVQLTISGLEDEMNRKTFETIGIDNLANMGFTKRGTKSYWFTKTIRFNPDDILKGLKNDDWQDALAPLKDAWDPLVKNIDWDKVSTLLNT